MDVGLTPQQYPAPFQFIIDRHVRPSNVLALEPRHVAGEAAVRTDGIDGGQRIGPGDLAVHLPEGRGLVHETGAVVGGDVVRLDDVTSVHTFGQVHVRERTRVVHARQRRAGKRRPGADAFAEDRLDQRGRDDESVDHRVRDLGVYRDRYVRQQRPGRRRPYRQMRRCVEPRVFLGVDDTQANIATLVGFVGVDVGLTKFVTGQRRAAARAVRDDLQVLVKQTPIEKLLKLPPHRLHVGRVKRVVRVLHVGPVADALGQLLELVDVDEHRLLAQPGEFTDADLLDDVALARDP